MTTTRVPARTDRSWQLRLMTGLLVFLGVTAIPGGAALATGLGAPPAAWLDDIPVVGSWVVPGLVLALGFGVGSLVTAYGVLRRPAWSWLGPVETRTGRHWSWVATLALGWGHVLWIGCEFLFLPEVSFLMVVYALTGLALGTLPLTKAVREDLRSCM